MSTITVDQESAIRDLVTSMHLASGLGTRDEACSVAAINLALTGRLSDNIPECMSLVIGGWMIVVQDAMPDVLRNSVEWRRLLPLAAGTGRVAADERVRSRLCVEWMDAVVLPTVQPVADAGGFGAEWRAMCDASAGAARAASAASAASAAGVARDAEWGRAWTEFDPVRLLTQMIEVGQ